MRTVEFTPVLQCLLPRNKKTIAVTFGQSKFIDNDAFAPQNKPKIHSFKTAGYRDLGEKFLKGLPVVLEAISDQLIDDFNKSGTTKPKPVIIGVDTTGFSAAGQLIAASHFLAKGFDVYAEQIVIPTPILTYYAKNWQQLGREKVAAGALIFTAGHNSWNYGGVHFLTPEGKTAPTSLTQKFEALQAKPLNLSIDRQKLGLPPALFKGFPQGAAVYTDNVKKLIDFDKIKHAKIALAFDSMYGAATGDFSAILLHTGLFDRTVILRQNWQQPWKGFPELPNGPDPISKNLGDLKNAVQKLRHPHNLKLGLANNGDGGRFGIIDEHGKFVQPNDVIALVLCNLIKNKRHRGVVVRNQATSHMLDELAQKYRLPLIQTPVGFNHIAEEFTKHEQSNQKVLIGAESSGGLSIYGHIPEKDGMIANLSILELMAYENKPVGELLESLKVSLDKQYVFTEMSIQTDKNDAIISHFNTLFHQGGQFAGLEVDMIKTHSEAEKLKDKFNTQDGIKLYFKDGSWLLARKSGTEPLMRIYFEAIEDRTRAALQKNTEYLQAVDKEKYIRPAALQDKKAALKKSNQIDRAVKVLLTKQFEVPENNIETRVGPNVKDD